MTATNSATRNKTSRGRRTYVAHAHLPETGFVRLPTILAVLPISRTTFLDGVRAGKYPKPVKPTPRTSMWAVEDIRSLLADLGKGAA